MIASVRQPQWWLQRAPTVVEMVLVIVLAWFAAGLLLPAGERTVASDDATQTASDAGKDQAVDLQLILD